MSRVTIDGGVMYCIEKYTNLDEGVKEVCPELLYNHRIKQLCYDLRQSRYLLKEELESMVVYEEDEDE